MLSVYNDARAGGTKKQTVVKKIVGDTRALRDELVEELQFPRDDVKINPVTNHIKIKVRGPEERPHARDACGRAGGRDHGAD